MVPYETKHFEFRVTTVPINGNTPNGIEAKAPTEDRWEYVGMSTGTNYVCILWAKRKNPPTTFSR